MSASARTAEAHRPVPRARADGRPDHATHRADIEEHRMAFESNYVTFIGNLTDDPELRFTQGGTPVATIRLASNRRWNDRDGQQQEETTYLNVTCWRDMAENVAETLHKGDRAIAIGRLKVRSYENREGQTVWTTEIEADEIAPSLRWARANISRTPGGAGGGGGGGSYGGGGGAIPPAAPLPPEDVPF
jgi:single-strand DNA-binding protein